MFSNEHDAAGKPVEPVTRHRVPQVAPVGAHNLDEGVVVVASRRVHGDTRGLVDDDQVVVFMQDADGLCGAGRFVPVEGVRDGLAVLDGHAGCHDLPVHAEVAGFDGVFLVEGGVFSWCS